MGLRRTNNPKKTSTEASISIQNLQNLWQEGLPSGKYLPTTILKEALVEFPTASAVYEAMCLTKY